ncbi:MAG: hypothetical protein HAW59_03425 [Betaproteobacteria bacterium]|nr:hypothetical protein [Betaproteobacteria bacterium]
MDLPTPAPPVIKIKGLIPTVLPTNASNPALTWAISGGNNAVASINGNTLHGLTVGTVNIIATADGVASPSTSFEVTPLQVNEITITSAATVVNGNTLELTASVLPDAASNKNITWSITAGSEFASLNGTTLTSTGVGTVTITATAADGSGTTASQDISVLPILVSGITITSRASVINGSTQNLEATVLPADAADRTVSWSITAGSGSPKAATPAATATTTATNW